MIGAMTWRLLTGASPRLLARFAYLGGWKGSRAVTRFQRRSARGARSPAFLFISLTDRCNLSCRGCWVTAANPPREMDPAVLDALITTWKTENRTYFFGLLGGEPLLYPHLLEVLERHRDCYFQVLTNGWLLDDAMAGAFRRLGNVTPLISIEGNPEVSDERRGARAVLNRSLAALETCRRHRLIFGVASSICKQNLEDLASETFVRAMIDQGAHYLWYYIYRPVGPDPAPELALEADEILRLRRFLVDARCRFPIMLIDAYWDAQGNALCPAAEGISHHIGPGGDIEPCPPIQFAGETIGTGRDINQRFENSTFLHQFRALAAEKGRGCLLLDAPGELHDWLQRVGARDTSGRGTGLAEIGSMQRRACHHLPGQEIPERHWLYRWAKRRWFFGFGAYG